MTRGKRFRYNNNDVVFAVNKRPKARLPSRKFCVGTFAESPFLRATAERPTHAERVVTADARKSTTRFATDPVAIRLLRNLLLTMRRAAIKQPRPLKRRSSSRLVSLRRLTCTIRTVNRCSHNYVYAISSYISTRPLVAVIYKSLHSTLSGASCPQKINGTTHIYSSSLEKHRCKWRGLLSRMAYTSR